MKFIFIPLILVCFINCFSQSTLQFGPKLKFSVDNSYTESFNSSFPNHYTHQDYTYKTPSFGIYGRTSTFSYSDTSKFTFNYTLEVGISWAKRKSKFTNVPENSYWETDTIGTSSQYSSKYKQLEIVNYIDFGIRLSNKYMLVNSLGLKIETPSIGKSTLESSRYIMTGEPHEDKYSNKRIQGSLYTDNLPVEFPLIMKITFSPKLIINYKSFSLNLHLTQDLFSLNKLHHKLNKTLGKYPRHTTVGIFFIPHKKTKANESELLKDDFDE